MKKLLLSLLLAGSILPAFAQSTLIQGATGWNTSTAGDLLVGTSSTLRYSRLSAGTTGYVLQASSTSPFKMAWVATSTLGIGGITNTYASSTFPSFTYASSTFPTFTYATGTFPTFTYASSTYATGTNYWSVTGSDISNVNVGNVGISTTTPTRTLEVFGNLAVGTTSFSQIITDTATKRVGINATSTALFGGASLTIGATSSAATGIALVDITTGTGISMTGLSNGTALNCTISGTGKCLTMNTTGNALTTAAALNITGSANMTADYTGAFITVTPTRNSLAASTRIHSGNIVNISPLYTLSGSAASSVVNVTGTTTQITRTLSNAATGATSSLAVTAPLLSVANLKGAGTGTTTDSSAMVDFHQAFTTGTGNAFQLENDGLGNMATFFGNGNFGIGTTSPSAVLSVQGVSASPSPLFTIASSTKAIQFSVDSKGHQIYGGTAPTVTACGSSPSVIGGNDNIVRLLAGGGVITACTVTFAQAWTNPPVCDANVEGGLTVFTSASSTVSSVTVTGASAITSDTITVQCHGY